MWEVQLIYKIGSIYTIKEKLNQQKPIGRGSCSNTVNLDPEAKQSNKKNF